MDMDTYAVEVTPSGKIGYAVHVMHEDGKMTLHRSKTKAAADLWVIDDQRRAEAGDRFIHTPTGDRWH